MIRIQSTANFTVHGIKSLVYGAAKVGKTRLAATAPAPIIASAEKGLLSLRGFNIPYVEINSTADLQQFYQWLAYSHEAQQFQTVVLDSLSEIIEVMLQSELRTAGRDPRRAYGEILQKGVQLFRDFRDLPGRHVLMIAKMEYDKDATGMMFYQPMFPGQKLGPALPYYPDEIFQLEVFTDPNTRQRVTALRCWPDQNHVAGDRSGALNEWEPPDLGHVFSKILAHKPNGV